MTKRLITTLFIAVLLAIALALTLSGCAGQTQSLEGKYMVTFDLGGGTLQLSTTEISTGSGVIKYAYEPGTYVVDPTLMAGNSIRRSGYVFTGWYTTPECNPSDLWDFENTLLETPTLTLYAGWKVAIVHSFTVAYKNEGGDIITLGKYEVDAGDKFSDRVNYASKREEYTPYGFYQDADCTIEWDRNSVHPGGEADTDVTVYVKYIKGEWAIVDNYTALKSALSAGQNVYLTADIDFGGEALNVTNVYSGIFNGNGHTISNFAVAKTGTTRNPACAIFSDLGDGAEIKDVSFASVSYTFNEISNTASSRKVAALAVKTSGAVKISNVSIEGSFTSDYSGELPEVNVAVFDAAEGTVITDFVSNITVNK